MEEMIGEWAIQGKERMPNGNWGLVTACPRCGGRVVQPRYAIKKNKGCQECFISSVYRGGNRTARHKVKYNHQVNQARKRGLEFSLTDEELDLLWSQNCTYCGTPPSNRMRCINSRGKQEEFVYSGLDRVDSSMGYVVGNVVPCCKPCNRAKSDMGLEEFLDWIRRVYATVGLDAAVVRLVE
jgi:hypothetical protein